MIDPRIKARKSIFDHGRFVLAIQFQALLRSDCTSLRPLPCFFQKGYECNNEIYWILDIVLNFQAIHSVKSNIVMKNHPQPRFNEIESTLNVDISRQGAELPY